MLKHEIGEYDRNRRYTVEKGTKFVHVIASFTPSQSPWDAADKAVRQAFKLARQRWAFRHDEIDYTVTILTSQVLVELRWRVDMS